MVRSEHVDVLIIGAGLSGIGAAAHLTRQLPRTSYVVLEAREVSGGTWDLFRYPGVRSDSDMYTMGYAFRPWRHDEALGSGERILEYLRDTAREYDVERRIRYSHRVVRTSWDSDTARWTVEAEHDDETVTFTAGLVWACGGYYDYDRGHEPEFAGADDFRGSIVHPQHWPADLDWTGKDVVVVGSGATAVTVVPAMTAAAAHVTMLQRSPTYVMSLPQRDAFAARARRWLPAGAAHRVVRWKSILVQTVFYRLARRIVTATGLTLSPFGGIEIIVDGEKVDPSTSMTYRALMLSEVPNFVFTVGYTNASWTLKVDLVAEFTCRLLSYLDEHGYRRVVPRRDPTVGQVPLMGFTSGYVLRALDQLPHQGDRDPWRLRQSYLRDRRTLRRAPLDDGVLDFS